MKTKLIALLALLSVEATEQSNNSPKVKRGSGTVTFAQFPVSAPGWQDDFNLQVDLPAPRRIPTPQIAPVIYINSNSIEKPVVEEQEYVPPQSVGSAVIPQMPPAATPVNALASNIPANRGAVFLGAGALGVLDLGNGAYALGSGALGYSENRSQPRPTDRVPVYPPLQAHPQLIPAAVPSPQAFQPTGFIPNQVSYNNPSLNLPQVPIVDQNGYEYLRPDRVGFGDPLPPRPVRIRQQFATPTAQSQQVPQLPANLPYFGHLV